MCGVFCQVCVYIIRYERWDITNEPWNFYQFFLISPYEKNIVSWIIWNIRIKEAKKNIPFGSGKSRTERLTCLAWVTIWKSSTDLSWKKRPHLWQPNSFLPSSCLVRCFVRFAFWAKVFPQVPQQKGFTLEWVSKCVSRLPFCEKHLPERKIL